MKAKDIMTANPDCCTAENTAQEAVRLMEEKDCGCIPVVEDQDSKKLVGVVTDQDIALRGVGQGGGANTPVEQVMSRGASCCSPEDDLQEVERVMAERQVRRVPVVDENDCCVGIIAQADLAIEEGHWTTEDEVGRVVERVSEPTDGPRTEKHVGHEVGD